MNDQQVHLTDEILLLFADDELAAEIRGDARTHLAKCDRCATRLQDIGNVLAEFGTAHRQALDSRLPSEFGARDTLRSELARSNSASKSIGNSWFSWIGSAVRPGHNAYVLASVVAGLLLIVTIYRHEIGTGSRQVSASLGLWAEPRANLTPGATIPRTQAQICGARADSITPEVPVSLQRKVLALYGVSATSSDAYEVDYLITPELGGATDLRNLWPEPYFDTTWNAHVKDQLEDRLHQMVCHGDIDLSTAQQDISKDWIAAYRKYFHTDQPLAAMNPSRRL